MISLLLTLGCTDLAKNHTWDDGESVIPTADTASPSDTGVAEVGLVTTEASGDGFHTVIDAKDAEDWVSVDLDADGIEVDSNSAEWDLQVRRYEIALNSGVSGDGSVEAVFVPDATLENPPAVPEDGWSVDQPDGSDDNDTPDLVFDTWYDYDSSTHVLSPKPGLWFLRSTEGAVFGLQVVNYYNDAGDSGWIALDWQLLSTPNAE